MRVKLSQEPQRIETDVLIIGTGGAGLRAAIEARRAGADVLVVSKMGHEDHNCTIRAWGGMTYAPESEVDELFRQVVETGGFLNNQRVVEVFVRHTPSRIRELTEFGCEMKLWGENPSPDRLGIIKLTMTGNTAGYGLTRPLRAKAEAMGVRFLEHLMISSLLVKGNQVTGALGVHLKEGKLVVIVAKAVILATGGGACLYERTDNPPGTTADGIALAYEAGAELVDMECVSFNFPTRRFDQLFSLRQVPDEELLNLGGAHYFLGGVRIDEQCRTSIDGLYACGEVTGGLFGAARLGGSALADVIVFGAIAGREAALYAKDQTLAEPDLAQVDAERARLEAMLSGSLFAAEFAAKIRSIMWRYCGTMKTAETLNKALIELATLEAQRSRLGVPAIADLREGIECLNMLTVAMLIARASLLREETRGCFWRIDFPKPDNARWIKNIYMRRQDGKTVHEIKPAIMTRMSLPTQPRIGAGCFGYLSQTKSH